MIYMREVCMGSSDDTVNDLLVIRYRRMRSYDTVVIQDHGMDDTGS